jgi:hypothetical protein
MNVVKIRFLLALVVSFFICLLLGYVGFNADEHSFKILIVIALSIFFGPLTPLIYSLQFDDILSVMFWIIILIPPLYLFRKYFKTGKIIPMIFGFSLWIFFGVLSVISSSM